MAHTPEQSALLTRLKADPRFYAKYALKVKDRATGELIPFEYTLVQNVLHEWRQQQIKDIGMVREVGIKGRQQTYSEGVQARYFHAAQMIPNTKVYVLSHEAKSTKVLFGKAQRYQENLPPQLVQALMADSGNKMKFANGSEYELGTANSENTGRSDTAQRLHLSEPAWYPEGCEEGIKSGLLQTVAMLPGTEIIWETTCNGHNWFYHFWLMINEGGTLYKPRFIPWYWTPEYRFNVGLYQEVTGIAWKLTEEEVFLHRTYHIDDAQLAWRRLKIKELSSLRLFKQEFPFNPDEAFQASGAGFFPTEWVDAAMKNTESYNVGPVVISCDPARTGDRCIITARRGREFKWIEKHPCREREMEQTRLAGILRAHIDKEGADKCFVDYAYGHGAIDILRNDGYAHIVEGVNFGGAADDDTLYANPRAEMYHALREMLDPANGGCRIPNDPDISADLAMIPAAETAAVTGKIKMRSKDEIKKLHKRSPDIADAMVLSLRRPVRINQARDIERQNVQHLQSGASELSSLRMARGQDESKYNFYNETDMEVVKAEFMRKQIREWDRQGL